MILDRKPQCLTIDYYENIYISLNSNPVKKKETIVNKIEVLLNSR